MLPGKKYKPEDVFWIVWRRKWIVIVPFALIFAGTFVTVQMIPDRFRSETVIQFVPQRVPESYVRSMVTPRATTTASTFDRLRSIQQQINSRTRLEIIIRDFNLYPSERQREPMEVVVERMRSDVAVNIQLGDAFRVAYTSDDPKKAMQVVERLASDFTNENLQDWEVLATATTDFLQSQLEDARRRLAEQESKVADFQRRHAGELPSERDANLQVLHNLQLQVQALLDSVNRDRDRRLLLERTLADLESAVPAAPVAAPAAPNGAPVNVVVGVTTAERLDAARDGLKALELRLTPEHPDVVYMKRLIVDLEAKVKIEAAQPGSAVPRPARARTPEEANTLRRIQETREELNGVVIALSSKQAEERRLRDQIAAVQKRVSATPKLEAELTALTRDYDTIRRGYESLLSKQEDSKVAAALEQRQIGEYFKVLDRARLPEGPSSPNRLLINLIGALAGLGVGLGLIALLEYRDNALRSEEDVLSVLRLPVLAAIPVIETSQDRRRARRRRVLGVVGAAVVFVSLAGAAAMAWVYGLIRLPLMSGNAMYEDFYGLRERPFDLTPNPRFMYLSGCHLEALSVVHYGIMSRKGITLLIGEAGTGKTTVVRAALEAIAQPTGRCVYMSNPTLTRAEFYEFLAISFGLTMNAAASKARFLLEFEQLLARRNQAGALTALVIDEAQSLSLELLEEVRLLANLETPTERLLPVVMAGQPELADMLDRPELRQLKQRVALRADLSPLGLSQAAAYVAGRIRKAGGDPIDVFTKDAIVLIHKRSGGIPRTISVLCDNSMLSGFAAAVKPIGPDIVEEVSCDFRLPAAGVAGGNGKLQHGWPGGGGEAENPWHWEAGHSGAGPGPQETPKSAKESLR